MSEGQQVFTSIQDLKPGLTHQNLYCMVLHVAPNSYKTKEGKEVRTCKIADKTGSVNLSVWGENCNAVQPSDILVLNRCYTTLFKSHMTVYIGKGGSIRKVGEFCMVFNDLPDMSEYREDWAKEALQQQQQQAQGNKNVQGYNKNPIIRRNKPLQD